MDLSKCSLRALFRMPHKPSEKVRSTLVSHVSVMRRRTTWVRELTKYTQDTPTELEIREILKIHGAFPKQQ